MTTTTDRAQRIDTLEWVLTTTCAGMGDEQVRATRAFKELATLFPDHPLVKGNRAERIDTLEEIVRWNVAIGTPGIRELPSFRELQRLHPTSRTLVSIR